MANQGINQLGIGLGYIYVTNFAVTDFIAIQPNTEAGMLVIRNLALKNAPIAANRSAIATITVTAAAAAGNLTDITIAGVSQIAAPVPCASASLPIVAQTWADALNAYTPPTGYKYTAAIQAEVIYVFAPERAGSSVNGLTPVISTDVGSLTATATSFQGGSYNTGIIDEITGYKYWLDADYGPSGIAGSTPAAPDPALPFLYAIEITNDVTRRGTETGLYNEDQTLSAQTLVVVRKSSITEYHLNNQGAVASDYLVRIMPTGFIEGDLLLLSNDNTGQTTTILSPPDAESLSATANPNIFLTNWSRFSATGNNVIMLQFHYDEIFGGIFREIGRSNPSSFITINHANTIYVDEAYGSSSGAREEFYPNVFQTADQALAVVQSGDTVVFRKGSYNISTQQLLGVANTHIDLTSGATITGTNFFATIAANTSIEGGNVILTGDTFTVAPGANCVIDCYDFEIGSMVFSGNEFNLNVRNLFTCHGSVVLGTANKAYITFKKAEFDGGGYCFNLIGYTADAFPSVTGDIYVTSGVFDAVVKSQNLGTPIVNNPRFKGKIVISLGVTTDYVIRAQQMQGGSVYAPYRFIVEAEIFCPITTTIAIVSGFAGGEVEFKGKIYATNQGTGRAVLSSNDYGTLNIPSKVWLTDCDIYSDTTGYAMYISDGAAITRSRIIGKNVKIIAPNAIKAIACDTAGGFYQCLGIFTNAPGPATNCSNELGTPDIEYDALMI